MARDQRKMAVAGLCLALLLGSATGASAAKDVVITTSGDRLVGEIKKVEKDVLTFSTDYSDSDFKIKWDKIASIESDRQFLVETFDGKRLSGPLKTDPEKKGGRGRGRHQRAAAGRVRRSALRTIVLVPVRCGFRLRLQHDAGELGETAHARGQPLLSRRARTWTRCSSTSSRARRRTPRDTQRWDLGNDFRHLLGSRWYVNTTQDFLNSDEQGLRPAHHDRRRRRAIPAALVVAVPGARRRAGVDQREATPTPRCRRRTPPRRISAPSS